MDDLERIKKIRKMQAEGFSSQKKQSLVLNNFYAIITIGVVSVSILFYINYVIPAVKEKRERELKAKKQQEYFEQRAKQIALSRKLNQQENNQSNGKN
jgi:hypothetical protein